ncbi:hypothetical protein H4582DRAFT_1938666 [Lactarius indigo]|nr:hypothetical protein H4582DRAFT_1938666 [Lactarius indigo]
MDQDLGFRPLAMGVVVFSWLHSLVGARRAYALYIRKSIVRRVRQSPTVLRVFWVLCPVRFFGPYYNNTNSPHQSYGLQFRDCCVDSLWRFLLKSGGVLMKALLGSPQSQGLPERIYSYRDTGNCHGTEMQGFKLVAVTGVRCKTSPSVGLEAFPFYSPLMTSDPPSPHVLAWSRHSLMKHTGTHRSQSTYLSVLFITPGCHCPLNQIVEHQALG